MDEKLNSNLSVDEIEILPDPIEDETVEKTTPTLII